MRYLYLFALATVARDVWRVFRLLPQRKFWGEFNDKLGEGIVYFALFQWALEIVSEILR